MPLKGCGYHPHRVTHTSIPTVDNMTLSRTYVTEPGHVIAAAMFLSVIDITAVALRFWARYKQREKFQADDLLMLPAVVRPFTFFPPLSPLFLSILIWAILT